MTAEKWKEASLTLHSETPANPEEGRWQTDPSYAENFYQDLNNWRNHKRAIAFRKKFLEDPHNSCGRSALCEGIVKYSDYLSGNLPTLESDFWTIQQKHINSDQFKKMPPEYQQNLKLLLHEIDNGIVELESLPITIELTIGLECNAKCLMCCQGDERRRYAESSLQFKSLLKRFVRAGTSYTIEKLIPVAQEVALIGGEVFSYPENLWGPVFEAAAEYPNCRTTTITNGSLLTPDMIDRYFGKIDSLLVSIDAPESELYENLRRGLSFNQVISNLKYIKEKAHKQGVPNPVKHISCILMKCNLRHLAGMIELCHDLDIDTILFGNLICLDPKQHIKSLPLDKRTDAMDQIERAAKKTGVNIVGGIEELRRRILPDKFPETETIYFPTIGG
jgi:sulfatase maturation enzyme AslB (radical SAM superfamily)